MNVGAGKSSFVHTLASKLGLDVCVVSIANGMVSDQGLQLLLNAAPPSSILLLEDVDVLFPDRATEGDRGQHSHHPASSIMRGADGKHTPMLTMSGLLNALDGISGQQGRMVFMTTNFVERLDEALVRSGRIDVKYLFDVPDESQAKRIFLKFFPEEKDLADDFAKTMTTKLSKRPSMADLQGFLLKHKEDAARARENLVSYFATN